LSAYKHDIGDIVIELKIKGDLAGLYVEKKSVRIRREARHHTL